jgi:hypothetical protein
MYHVRREVALLLFTILQAINIHTFISIKYVIQGVRNWIYLLIYVTTLLTAQAIKLPMIDWSIINWNNA